MNIVFSAQEDEWQKLLDEMERKVNDARRGAVKDVAELAVKDGRAEIASTGFSSRWQQGLRFRFYPNSPNGDPAAVLYHRIGLANIFETGKTISGKPLLWVPIGKKAGVNSPRKYGKKLVSVNIAGKPPLLFDAADRKLGPLFVGIRTATLRKRWNIRRIYERAMAKLLDFYEQRIKG